MGIKERRRGVYGERNFVKRLVALGLEAKKVSMAWRDGPDIHLKLDGRTVKIEHKQRKAFAPWAWFRPGTDLVVVTVDRQEPLWLIPESFLKDGVDEEWLNDLTAISRSENQS